MRQRPRFLARATVLFAIYNSVFSSTFAFSSVRPLKRPPLSSSTTLGLIPLVSFADEITFFSESASYRCCINDKGQFVDKDYESGTYELALVEPEDTPDLCKFIVTAFGADAIRISQDMNRLEKLLLSPGVELLNGYSSLVAFSEVFSGTNQRLASRFAKKDISPPQLEGLSREEMIQLVERDSLILAMGRRSTSEDALDIIASIELRLQPCDAKIPFSLPWLDKVERRLAAITSGLGRGRDLQPYLSNLCVDDRFRGKKIGRALVRCVEDIAKSRWGYNRIYLHVDEDNGPALSLYQTEGYRDAGRRWNPFWAGSAADIGYYVKKLKS